MLADNTYVQNFKTFHRAFVLFCPGNYGKCDIVNSRVFSSRRQLRKFKIRQRKRSKKQNRRRNSRVKRDRSLLALSGPKYWPRWCNKIAFFRVFRHDYTLCLYTRRFRDDPILAYSNPNIGTTIYGYKDKKNYMELGETWTLFSSRQRSFRSHFLFLPPLFPFESPMSL